MKTGAQLRVDPSIVGLLHEERIELVAEGASETFQSEAIDHSWQRCLHDFQIDPRSRSVPHLVAEREFRISREPLNSFLLQAQDEIDRLHAIVPPSSSVARRAIGQRIFHEHLQYRWIVAAVPSVDFGS